MEAQTVIYPKYSGEHDDVIQEFEMKDKPSRIAFDPQNEEFRKLVRYALKKAFNDFNFRTLTKEKSFDSVYKKWDAQQKEMLKMQKESITHQEAPSVTGYLVERLGKPFEDRFVKYFSNAPLSREEFDNWHHQTCKMFLDQLNGKNNGSVASQPIYTNLKYGKAQKIVNMMFKHLYCFKSQEIWKDKWDPYFQYCHVTLDNFTLTWFEREVCPHQRIESWSNLDFTENAVDKNNYTFYLEHIRKFFDKQKLDVKSPYREVTPFQAEFYIWPDIQLRLAAEALFFELKPDEYKGNGKAAKDNRNALMKLDLLDLLDDLRKIIYNYLY